MIIFYRNDVPVMNSDMCLAQAMKVVKHLRCITPDRWHLSAKFLRKSERTFVFGGNHENS